jgi:hypothetical protein
MTFAQMSLRVHEVGFPVQDLQRAVCFYQDTLGFTIVPGTLPRPPSSSVISSMEMHALNSRILVHDVVVVLTLVDVWC